jgi:hypothetical protein
MNSILQFFWFGSEDFSCWGVVHPPPQFQWTAEAPPQTVSPLGDAVKLGIPSGGEHRAEGCDHNPLE